MKKAIPIIFLILITSCSQINYTIDKTGSAIDKGINKASNTVRNYWQKDLCTRIYQEETISITTSNISSYYIIYLWAETDQKADFDLWENLENNNIIRLKTDENNYQITNLLPPTIEVCTKMKEDKTETSVSEISKKETGASDSNAGKLISHDLI